MVRSIVVSSHIRRARSPGRWPPRSLASIIPLLHSNLSRTYHPAPAELALPSLLVMLSAHGYRKSSILYRTNLSPTSLKTTTHTKTAPPPRQKTPTTLSTQRPSSPPSAASCSSCPVTGLGCCRRSCSWYRQVWRNRGFRRRLLL